MQRLFAHLVLLITLGSYAAPALLIPSEADLPACCRGRGKHHCAMLDMARSKDVSPAFRTSPQQCPYRQLGSIFSRSVIANAPQFCIAFELPATNASSLCCADDRASTVQIHTSGRSPPVLAL